MGVHGLWRLIEPSGQPVPLETLENKTLAVDVSIWLHQIIKGFQDNRGGSVPNAHLLGIFHRVCKLLYFKIKPVFVFDGGVPVLKRNTIALRSSQKLKNQSEADRIHKNLLSALVKHTAISKVLSEKTKAAIAASTSPTKKPKVDDELYVLPPSQLDSTVSEDDSESEGHVRHYDLHSINTQSVEFKSLPVDVRHEILTDLKETRKQSSWGRINELPTESDDFSIYQMNRLLKRQSVQSALENVEKEMGGHSLSLGELETLLKDQGVITSMKGNRIASDENTRYLLIKDIKQALEDARKNLATIEEEEEECKKVKNKGDEEFEDDLNRAIALSLEEQPSTSKKDEASTSTVRKIGAKGKKRMPLSFLPDFKDADFGDSESSEEEEIITRLTPAQRYMMEYSGLTSHAIAKIIASKSGVAKKATDVRIQEAESTTTYSKEIIISDDDDIVDSIELNGNPSATEIQADTHENEVSTSVGDDVTSSGDKEKDLQTMEEATDGVEVMSDSESSNCDDFVDVELGKETSVEAMEVVIKPDEGIDDDLFNDVFSETKVESEKSKTASVSSSQDKVTESIKLFASSTDEDTPVDKETSFNSEKSEETNGNTNENVEAVDEAVVESKTTSQSTMEKIQKMIQTYSKDVDNVKESNLSVDQLTEMKENLRKEQSDLVAERSSKERLAGNITDQMCQEAQELLELFGVPYLIAPMEAEAQCAFLDLIELADGTITDDSDIWLFGGRTVYKNFFDQKKVVMEFRAGNIHNHFKLSREQMILLAMLVGSDYTTGLTGVGPVTALEILAAFPPKNQLTSGLAEFKAWFKKGRVPGPGRTALRSKVKNVVFGENFPNPKIVDAYLEPNVETSKETFTWGKPDVPGLIEFARQKFGWTKLKSEEILHPILKRLEDKKSQKSITDFFKYESKIDSAEPEKMMSKRVKSAVNRIARGHCDDEEEEVKKKRVVRKKKSEDEPKTKKQKIEDDEEVKILKETEERSKRRVEEIQNEVTKEVEEKKAKVDLKRLHGKEVIPQRQKDKSDVLKNKMKAIEVFRKSKQGPGYVKKKGKVRRGAEKDASYLSEGSSSD